MIRGPVQSLSSLPKSDILMSSRAKPRDLLMKSKTISEIPGWLTPHEGQFLEKAAFAQKYRAGVIVEIGSFQGRSTIRLAQSGEIVYAIDPHKGICSGGKMGSTLLKFRKNISAAGVSKQVVPIVKTSKEAARRWNKPIKLLYIDGLHEYDHVMEDFALWSPFVAGGGMIAMHDAFCALPGPADVAMRHMVYGPDYKEAGVIGSIMYGVKGKATFFSRLNKLRNQLVIELAQAIHRTSWVPGGIKFVLVHRFLRIFLINQFTSFM